MEEENEEENVSVDSGKMEYIIALYISDQRIGSILQKQIDNIVMTSLRSPHGWWGDRISSLDVDISARFNQVFAERIVIVDCCPLISNSISNGL